MANPYCEACRHEHGPCYICPHYPEERKAEILRARDAYLAQLRDPVWIEEQIARGVDPEVIAVYRALAAL